LARLSNKHQNVRPFNITDLRGGINLYSPADMLADNEARNLENFEFDVNGDRLMTRGGLSAPFVTFSDNIKAVFYDYEMNDYLVFLENKDAYKYIIGNTPLLLGKLSGDLRPVCCKYGGKVIIASGDRLQSYDYTNLTTILESPLCDDVFERFGRLAVTKTGTDDIVYSAIGDITGWTDDPNDDSTAKETPIGYQDGGDIVGVHPLATDIIVFKSNGKIFQLAGEPPDGQSVFQVAKDSDFVYRFGVTNLGSELIYMSKQGLRSLSTSTEYGNFQNREFGAKVNGELAKQVYHPIIWNLPRKKQMLIRPYEGGKILAYHYLLGAFTLLNFPQTIVDIVESPTEVVVASGNSLFYWSQNYSTDNGTAITAKIKSKQIKSIQDILVKRMAVSVDSAASCSATIKINGVPILFAWANAPQTSDLRFQIKSKVVDVEFSTTSKLSFGHILMETVVL